MTAAASNQPASAQDPKPLYLPVLPRGIRRSLPLVHRAGCMARFFIHDPLDGMGAAAALGAAAEAGIDLAHARPSSFLRDN